MALFTADLGRQSLSSLIRLSFVKKGGSSAPVSPPVYATAYEDVVLSIL